MRALPGCPSPAAGANTSNDINAAICFEYSLLLVFSLCQNVLDYIDVVP